MSERTKMHAEAAAGCVVVVAVWVMVLRAAWIWDVVVGGAA